MLLNVLSSLALAIAFTIIYVGIQVSRNSLRHVPGPAYSLFTTLPLKFAVLTGKRVHHIHALHTRYGRIVRIGPNELSIADPLAFKTIHKVGLNGYVKSPWYFAMTSGGIRAVFNYEDNAQHAQRRKLLSPGFTKSNLRRDWEGIICGNACGAVQRMREDATSAGGYVDIYKWWLFFAADTSGDVMFGESFGMLERGERNEYMRNIEAWMIMVGVGYEVPLLPKGLLKTLLGAKESTMAGYGQKAIEASKAANVSRRNVFATMNAEAEKGEELDDHDIACEAGNLLVGGTDTTASTLTYLTWTVVKSPGMAQRLVAELSGLKEEQLTDAHLSTLPYLNAVINETLRLYNGAPSSLPRVVPQGGATLGGFEVPEDTIVGTQAWTIHRLTEYWGADATVFRPERWLVSDGTMMFPEKARDAFVPWGGGAKACLGLHLAMMALRLAVACFVREFGTSFEVGCRTTEKSMEVENYFVIVPKAHACWLKITA